MSKRRPDILQAGEYVEYRPGQGHRPAAPGTPDYVICRRVADFPGQHVPAGGAVGHCTRCQSPVVFNPKGPHLDRPRRCMQCAHIEPLPIES